MIRDSEPSGVTAMTRDLTGSPGRVQHRDTDTQSLHATLEVTGGPGNRPGS